jgi:hypothetical protein
MERSDSLRGEIAESLGFKNAPDLSAPGAEQLDDQIEELVAQCEGVKPEEGAHTNIFDPTSPLGRLILELEGVSSSIRYIEEKEAEGANRLMLADELSSQTIKALMAFGITPVFLLIMSGEEVAKIPGLSDAALAEIFNFRAVA